MSNLIELLTLETQTAKEQYLAQMQTWAEKQVVWNIARYADMPPEQQLVKT